MARSIMLLSCLLAAAVLAAHAQEECAGPLRELQGKLDAKAAELDAKAAAHQAVEGSLQAAKQQVADLQAKLVAAEAEAAQQKRAAEAAAAASASCTSGKAAAESKAQQAKQEAAAIEAKLASLQGQVETLAALQTDLDKAREDLATVRAAHEGEWLPHWLEVRSRSTLEAVGPALKQGQELLATHAKPALEKVKPALERAVSFGKEKATELGAAIEKHGGEKLPQVKALLASAAQKVKAAAQSEQVQQAKAAASRALAQAKATLAQVQAELETFLIGFLKKYPSSAPLARRPYVTYISYLILGAPAVAVGLPMLGRLVSGSGSRASSGSSSPARGGPKGPGAKRRPKRA